MPQYIVQFGNHEIKLTEVDLQLQNILKLESDNFHIIFKNYSVEAQIENIDLINSKVTLLIDQQKYTYKIQNELALTIARLGFQSKSSNQEKEISAPMPGIVLKIEVAEGDTIIKGQNLLTLEAMKMENIIKANTSGIIKNIIVQNNEKVDKNQIMIILE
ncbi:MAG: acetyl-CoA carboxylase biotin carboxyl carrier protein subunit [Saprospiraceae bacterium]